MGAVYAKIRINGCKGKFILRGSAEGTRGCRGYRLSKASARNYLGAL